MSIRASQDKWSPTEERQGIMEGDPITKRARRRLKLFPRVMLAAVCVPLVTASFGCPAGPVNEAGPSTGGGVSFANDIQPIFTELCIGCHVIGGLALQQGIVLRLASGVSFDLLVNQKSVQNTAQTLVIPGDSANSLLFAKVSQDSPPVGATMPLVGGRRLTSAELALVRDWIDQGALNN